MKFDKVIQYDGFIHDPCRAYLYIDQINYIVDASNNFEYGDGYL